jgi:DNA replication protein DnaC
LGKTRWTQLHSLNWFKQHQHVLMVGPTGIGKSYLSCALAKAVIDTNALPASAAPGRRTQRPCKRKGGPVTG